MREIITFFNFSTSLCQTHSGYLTWWLNIKETIKAQNMNFLKYKLKLDFGFKMGNRRHFFSEIKIENLFD